MVIFLFSAEFYSLHAQSRARRQAMQENEGEFFIRITNLRSSGGKIMNPTEIKNLEPNSFYKYSRGKNKWQKSGSCPFGCDATPAQRA